jgi:hypothetical protein
MFFLLQATTNNQLCYTEQIDIDEHFLGSNCNQLAYMTVDGINCPIQEPSPFSSIWYSH